jgi:Leucine-rich repeat (LRR) protein
MTMDAGELFLEEWDDFSRIRTNASTSSVILSNSEEKPVNGPALARRLASIRGINRIRTLRVDRSSRVTDLDFLHVMPNLQRLFIYGRRLETLEGLESVINLQFVEIDTGRNSKRSLEAIRGAQITKLSLWWATPTDTDAVAGSTSLRELELTGCRELSPPSLREVPLEHLRLERAKMTELANLSAIRRLESLFILNCSELRRFQGDNSGIKTVVVEACNRIEVASIRTFGDVETLHLVSIKHEIPLAALGKLDKLRSLSIQDSRLKVDVKDLTARLPQLEELWADTLRKHQLIELSEANPTVVIQNGAYAFRNGHSIEDE